MIFTQLSRKNTRLSLCISLLFAASSNTIFAQTRPAYLDETQPIDTRVRSLISSLTIEEKASLMGYRSKAVPRLGIPAYNWWNEGLHGVARAGQATVFPQAIALAATFNDELVYQVANTISTEARAKYNLGVKKDRRLQYMGLTFWSPNINIFRDPRWGRGQETYGEDPYLTSIMGAAYVRGMQGTDPLRLKTSATAKHFVAHSGPEATRDEFDAIVNEKDLRETYLPAFKALVDHGVESVMTAYNRVNGEPNSTSRSYLNKILIKEWGFKGHVVTDCGALDDVFLRHKVLKNGVETAAAAIKAGIGLDCSSVLQNDVVKAIKQGLITEADVNKALTPVLRTEFKLGFFDQPQSSPYYSYGADSINNAQHIALARQAAQQSMVLLKNKNGVLPLKKDGFSSIMVLGTNASSLDVLAGSYHGVNSKMVDFVEGITGAVEPDTRVEYDLGSSYTDTTHFGGIWGAGNADVTVAVIGLSPVLEGEAGDAFLSTNGGDKIDLSLPAGNVAFIKALRKGVPNKPIIAVVTSGSAVDIAAIEPYVDAIVLAWYPGEQGGNAFADILLGKVSPSGRLPLTFYRSVNDLPPYNSYVMKGRTYRYHNGPVQYPFGFGLSYTTFDRSWEQRPRKTYGTKDSISFSVKVKNTGAMKGDEVVQAYIEYPDLDRMPIKELKAFKRVSLNQGESKVVNLAIPVKALQKWDDKKHQWQLYKGTYRLVIGENSASAKLKAEFSIRP
ncbi:glycoside hydrolase family 3 C-terminal domain-containing protein [Mucilaginibacter daejeonensis]|uniref:glycoside hydrolase family 3 N-terminal domain-containing protein n=1 Tax=Mucilaginibacter daejeonensis TaxID=398049 RepID=UPI001D17181A|nr:glycoside hydrolase family 3 N-terminal domain-containing protein [Mucilaginibacter daejeonensis]UEG54079.1 glycoside hydrolase family 3 C-terminal domain-containing protein [Mucilaginibacter daejeonensis]